MHVVRGEVSENGDYFRTRFMITNIHGFKTGTPPKIWLQCTP